MNTELAHDQHAVRVRAVFGLPTGAALPPVNTGTLLAYRDHLAAHWPGPPAAGRFTEPGRSQTVEIVLCGISDWVDETRGLLGHVAGELARDEQPLAFIVLAEEESFGELLDDYRAWFSRCVIVSAVSDEPFRGDSGPEWLIDADSE